MVSLFQFWCAGVKILSGIIETPTLLLRAPGIRCSHFKNRRTTCEHAHHFSERFYKICGVLCAILDYHLQGPPTHKKNTISIPLLKKNEEEEFKAGAVAGGKAGAKDCALWRVRALRRPRYGCGQPVGEPRGRGVGAPLRHEGPLLPPTHKNTESTPKEQAA